MSVCWVIKAFIQNDVIVLNINVHAIRNIGQGIYVLVCYLTSGATKCVCFDGSGAGVKPAISRVFGDISTPSVFQVWENDR